jgi:hypothetical protein
MAALGQQQKLKAIEILKILDSKGFKKAGKLNIRNALSEPDKIDYDEIIEFYQKLLIKEREQVEEDKKKKLREVELWTRAVREEEKLAI